MAKLYIGAPSTSRSAACSSAISASACAAIACCSGVRSPAGVPIAAGVLYPVLGLLLSPMIAAAAMSLSSVSVIGNALRLNRVKL